MVAKLVNVLANVSMIFIVTTENTAAKVAYRVFVCINVNKAFNVNVADVADEVDFLIYMLVAFNRNVSIADSAISVVI